MTPGGVAETPEPAPQEAQPRPLRRLLRADRGHDRLASLGPTGLSTGMTCGAESDARVDQARSGARLGLATGRSGEGGRLGRYRHRPRDFGRACGVDAVGRLASRPRPAAGRAKCGAVGPLPGPTPGGDPREGSGPILALLPSFVDRAIARKITGGLLQLLSVVQRPDHPWRTKLGEAIERLIARLAADPEFRCQGEELKARVLADRSCAVTPDISCRSSVNAFKAACISTRASGTPNWSGAFRTSAPDSVTIQSYSGTRTLVRRGLAPRRDEIGRCVAQMVAGWDARSVVERLELQVGPDLQLIRVNGTIVGGLVGHILYSAPRWARLL